MSTLASCVLLIGCVLSQPSDEVTRLRNEISSKIAENGAIKKENSGLKKRAADLEHQLGMANADLEHQLGVANKVTADAGVVKKDNTGLKKEWANWRSNLRRPMRP